MITNETTLFRLLWALIAVIWIFSEIALYRRQHHTSFNIIENVTSPEKQLWIALIFVVLSALLLKTLRLLPLPWAYIPSQIIGITFVCIGLDLRYSAVKELANFFSTQLKIIQNHTIIDTGPYQVIRHPAYAGILIAFFGAGIAMGDFLSLIAILLPTFATFRKRMIIEENMLIKALGLPYQNYCQKTWRFIPYIY